MVDSQQTEIEADKPSILTPAEEKLVETLRPMYWPKGSGSQLEQFVHESWKNYTRWMIKRKAMVVRWKEKPGIADRSNSDWKVVFFDEHCNELRRPVADFVLSWAEMVNRQVLSWAEWRGDLRSFIFSEENKEFQRMGDGTGPGFRRSGRTLEKVFRCCK